MKTNLERELRVWDNPISTTEDQHCNNMKSMIIDAIKSNTDFTSDQYEIFIQGSYANDTNVKANSDIDICIMYKKTFFPYYPTGKVASDYGNMSSDYQYDQYKQDIVNALINKFGRLSVTLGDKSIKISENTYRTKADVVPAFEYKVYNEIKYLYSGTQYITASGKTIINYPKQHIDNTLNKNKSTAYWYKKMVRSFKKVMFDYQDNGLYQNIKSFVLESILYNIDNSFYAPDESSKSGSNDNRGLHTNVFSKLVNNAILLLSSKNDMLFEPNEKRFLFKQNSDRNYNIYFAFFNSIRNDYL
ncbi:MAG: nucleotidyltransferase [Acholeplasmataceae bacterium]|nr:nucleotidyltransferase [Acholeplasmataceae bacterium]